MKKYILLLVFTFQLGLASEKDSLVPQNPFIKYQKIFRQLDDCDACGCSASGGSMGFASMLNSNFVGLRYFYQSYLVLMVCIVIRPGTTKISIPFKFGHEFP